MQAFLIYRSRYLRKFIGILPPIAGVLYSRKRQVTRMYARIAGGLYFVSVASAVANEALVHGKLLYLVSLVPIGCFLIATVLLYIVFKGVNATVALLAAGANIVSLGFEAVELHPGGMNAGLVFHGLYCILIGYLAYHSRFVPRIFGALMIAAGLAWLTNISPLLASRVSPYNEALGFIGEGALMLWLLAMGVKAQSKAAFVRPSRT